MSLGFFFVSFEVFKFKMYYYLKVLRVIGGFE